MRKKVRRRVFMAESSEAAGRELLAFSVSPAGFVVALDASVAASDVVVALVFVAVHRVDDQTHVARCIGSSWQVGCHDADMAELGDRAWCGMKRSVHVGSHLIAFGDAVRTIL